MKILKSAQAEKDAKRLAEVSRLRLELEKEEKALKAYFLEMMGDENIIKAGEAIVTKSFGTTTYYSKDLIITYFGAKGAEKCKAQSQYEKLSVTLEAK